MHIMDLPSTEELKQLPLRAVVAYVVRTARRLSSELRGTIDDDAVEDLLSRIEVVYRSDTLEGVDEAAIILAGAKVAAAMECMEPHQTMVALTLTRAAMVTQGAFEAYHDPSRLPRAMDHAVRESERAVSAIDFLSATSAARATAAALAARQDFERLLLEYGKQDELIFGEPVLCFDD